MSWFTEICFKEVGQCGSYPSSTFVLMVVGISLFIGLTGLVGCYVESKYVKEWRDE
ncbi:hypothetical protein LCGC14_2915880 [marine sediment metagenome]|uniref:Uncharacterized protein n=1 Tax=marine sediment metagenome TaxID=412755 RepID=A0A0F9AGC1_9ZZZZ